MIITRIIDEIIDEKFILFLLTANAGLRPATKNLISAPANKCSYQSLA